MERIVDHVSSQRPRPRPVVLVVARSPQAVDAAREALGAQHIVLGARSGGRAIALAAQEPRPHLVVLDEDLPDMAALAVLEALHGDSRTRDVPVVFTGTQATFDRLCRFVGCLADFIAQPVGAEVLKARVRLHLDLQRLREDLRERECALQREAARGAGLEASLDAATSDLAAIGYSVSHDLRAPLATLSAFASSLLPEQASLSEKGRDRLDRIVTASRRLRDTVDDVLRYCGAAHAPMCIQPVDLADIADDVIAELGAGTDTRFSVEPLPRVRADRTMMREIMENLVGNAIKFSAFRADARVEIQAHTAGELAQIVVRDNGIGFDMGYRDKLFRLFQRLHPQAEFPGSGVGLAVVQRLVTRQGGDVAADSVAGGWTSFSFSVPLCQPAWSTACAADRAAGGTLR